MSDIKLDTGTSLPKGFVFTKEFESIFEKIEKTRNNYFITGKAGCGKSTLLEWFRTHTKKNIIICAPTGVTAIKARGKTLHSVFKIPPKFVTKDDVKPLSREAKKLLMHVDTLLIDEASMVRADTFDAIDQTLRLTRKSFTPFGGVQIILFGDLYQLPPVVTSEEKEVVNHIYPDGPYFFNSRSYQEVNFETLELTKIFRQTEKDFIELLDKVRSAKVKDIDLKVLNRQYQEFDFEPPKGTIILTPRNAKVDAINNKKLNEIESEEFTFTAQVKGNFKEKEFPVEEQLRLKVGAQVMIVKNDHSHLRRWVNGTLATIESLEKDKVFIKIGRNIFNLGRSRWEKINYKITGGMITSDVIATYTQYPIKLAWATSIHKVQGQTFDKVAIDLDQGAFTHGQTYVALSRAKTIEGIYLMKKIGYQDFIFDERVFKFLGMQLPKKYTREYVLKNHNQTFEIKSSLPSPD